MTILLDPAIHDAAELAKLPVSLVKAVCRQESSFRPWAWNPEPRYRYLWDIKKQAPFRPLTAEENASEIPPPDFPAPPGVDRDAEWWGQQASWGLMQLMGAVPREYGFPCQDLPELCDVTLNLWYGCRHLSVLLGRHRTWAATLSAYNSGSPTSERGRQYAAKVIAFWLQYEPDRVIV
jgi:hypothetical protein